MTQIEYGLEFHFRKFIFWLLPDSVYNKLGGRRWHIGQRQEWLRIDLKRREKMRLNSLDEILRFAVRKEADAAAFYRMAADRSNPGVKKAFQELAKEEDGQKKKSGGFAPKKIEKMEVQETRGLGLSEMMEDVPYSSEMSYADLLR